MLGPCMPAISLRRISLLLLCFAFLFPAAWGQVFPANEIRDLEMRALQERNMDDFKQLGADIFKLPTDYPFYLSRKTAES